MSWFDYDYSPTFDLLIQNLLWHSKLFNEFHFYVCIPWYHPHFLYSRNHRGLRRSCYCTFTLVKINVHLDATYSWSCNKCTITRKHYINLCKRDLWCPAGQKSIYRSLMQSYLQSFCNFASWFLLLTPFYISAVLHTHSLTLCIAIIKVIKSSERKALLLHYNFRLPSGLWVSSKIKAYFPHLEFTYMWWDFF